ncbi:methionyl-tRNA formyltransferase [Streptomyces roseicoloratus]|uniref:Formyltransferase family protein n=1 Tax=Streptomyces roseicoloratus TaxID=2508722 RepID=A0ABY9RQW1_9ACTN|nr:formyltransferase family protein [Streptomyces roseicoloratus]WMX44089.1 formyltransferase family protein [Streptomyces roseicoloratus]
MAPTAPTASQDPAGRIRVVLFSEVNSKLGSPFLSMLHGHPQVDLAAVVTSPQGKRCSYFTDDPEQVDLVTQGAALGVPVLRPSSVNRPAFVEELEGYGADYFVVANFQQILRERLLSVPRVTAVNFHPSPLPAFAGLSPFYWMIREGATESAVSAIEMAPVLDSGDLIMQHQVPLTGNETAIELRTAQERANVLMLLELIPQLVDRSYRPIPQDPSRRSYFGRPSDADLRLDFRSPAAVVARHVRAGYRSPGAWTADEAGRRVRILSADPAPADAPGRPPVPGLVVHGAAGRIFAGCADGWLEVLTTECDGRETAAGGTGQLPDGTRLVSPNTPAPGEPVSVAGRVSASGPAAVPGPAPVPPPAPTPAPVP